MSFVVKIFKQDISFEVHEKESILEAALKQGINLPYGCRNGECGSCIAEIKSGSSFTIMEILYIIHKQIPMVIIFFYAKLKPLVILKLIQEVLKKMMLWK
tara:strand:- start:188 stop:487 length:300 start_codon:yes stop_codon:yes gene_type:complete